MNAIYTLLILLIPFFVKSQDLIYVPDNFLEEYLESHPVFGNEFRENQAVRNLELDKIRVNAYREVAVEYVKNQPKTINYNNIYWR